MFSVFFMDDTSHDSSWQGYVIHFSSSLVGIEGWRKLFG